MTQELSQRDADSTIYEASIEGIMNVMKKHCVRQKDKAVDVFRVAGAQGMREAARRNQGKPEFPFFTFMVESVQKDRDSYPARNMKRMGVMTQVDKQKGSYYKAFLKPIIVNLTVRFYCQSDTDADYFIKNWMYKDELLIFDLMIGNAAVTIRALIDDSLQVPEMDGVINEQGEIFQFETVLQMRTYVGSTAQFTSINQINSAINVPSASPTGNSSTDVIVVGEEKFMKKEDAE